MPALSLFSKERRKVELHFFVTFCTKESRSKSCGRTGLHILFSDTKKGYLPIFFSLRRWRDLNWPTSKHSRLLSFSALSRHTPCFSPSAAPFLCHWQRSHPKPAPLRRKGSPIFKHKKRISFDILSSTEMEGFEPSRRVNDLYP